MAAGAETSPRGEMTLPDGAVLAEAAIGSLASVGFYVCITELVAFVRYSTMCFVNVASVYEAYHCLDPYHS